MHTPEQTLGKIRGQVLPGCCSNLFFEEIWLLNLDGGGREVKDIEAQTRLCLENMKRVLAAAGASLDAVVKVTVFLRSEKDFSAMNKVYQGYFGEDKPARSTVITGLALPSMLVEIECIAYAPSSCQRRTRKTGSKGNLR